MESLAYTLVHLACGRHALPWAHQARDMNILHRKVAWRPESEEAQLPPVLAQFVSSTRALGFDAEPEYAHWRAAFRALVPELDLRDDVFDPADDGLLVVDWAQAAQIQPQIDAKDEELPNCGQPPSDSASDSDSIPDSDDGWVPTSVWPAPLSIRLSDLFGDGEEQAIVRNSEQLEWIEEPPEMVKAWLVQCDCPEKMVEF